MSAISIIIADYVVIGSKPYVDSAVAHSAIEHAYVFSVCHFRAEEKSSLGLFCLEFRVVLIVLYAPQ